MKRDGHTKLIQAVYQHNVTTSAASAAKHKLTCPLSLTEEAVDRGQAHQNPDETFANLHLIWAPVRRGSGGTQRCRGNMDLSDQAGRPLANPRQ